MPHAGKDAQSRRAARAFNRGGEILAVARAHDRILVAAREPQRRRVATREADRLGLLDRPDLAHRLFGAAALFERQAIIGTGKRSEEQTSELQSLMRTSYAVFCLKKKKRNYNRDS